MQVLVLHEYKRYPDPEQECQLVVKGYSGYQREEKKKTKKQHPNTGDSLYIVPNPIFAPRGFLSSTASSESVG